MTETLHDDLAALAATAALPVLDLGAVDRAVRRRRARRRLVALSVVAACAAGGAISTVVGAHDRVTLQPAHDESAPVPTRAALEDALVRTLPGSRVDTVSELGRAYLEPGTTAFAGRNRTGAVTARVTTAEDAPLLVQWNGLDRALDADEANQLVDGLTTVDPQGVQPPAELLHEEPVVGGDVRAYRLHSPPDPDRSTLAVFAWSMNGTYATLTRSAPTSGEARAVQQLLALARVLVGRPDHGDARADANLCRKALPAAEAVDADLRSEADPAIHLSALGDALAAGAQDADLDAAVDAMAVEVLPAAQAATDPRVRINGGDFTDFGGRLAQLARACATVVDRG